MPVHEDHILTGLGRTPVKIVVIEKERSPFRGKYQDEIRNSAGRVSWFQQKEGAIRSGLINAMPVQFGIPFVTRAFGGEPTHCIGRALEDRCAACVRAGGSANVSREDIADTRQRICGIDGLRRKDLRTRQALLIIIGINTGGNPQLPKIVHASRVIGFGLRSAQSGQEQARRIAMMAITTSNSMRVKARHGYQRAHRLRTPAQRFASRGCVFIGRVIIQ